MTSVSREVAEAEVTAWLDKKKILQGTRDRNQEYINTLVDALSEGIIVIDGNPIDGKKVESTATKEPTWKIKHTLQFPFGEDKSVHELEYLARLTDKMVKPYMVGVKADDADGRLLGYVAALSRQPRAVLENLDSLDKKIAMSVAVFFL